MIPGSRRSPGGGNGNTHTPVFLPGESYGQRSLAAYSSWGYKKSDMTERLSGWIKGSDYCLNTDKGKTIKELQFELKAIYHHHQEQRIQDTPSLRSYVQTLYETISFDPQNYM